MSKTRDIREAVEAELRFDPLVDSSGVMVQNTDGAVALDGTVPGYPQYLQAAVAAVGALTGVRGIRNEIEVNYDTEPAHITIAVQHALARSALVPDDSDVKAVTAGNTVTLTGHVRTAAEHDAVVGATWMADGVYAVIDELHITG